MIRDAIRLPIRTAGFVGLTFSMYGALEVDLAVAGPNADRMGLLS